jgi:hypothetical protein
LAMIQPPKTTNTLLRMLIKNRSNSSAAQGLTGRSLSKFVPYTATVEARPLRPRRGRWCRVKMRPCALCTLCAAPLGAQCLFIVACSPDRPSPGRAKWSDFNARSHQGRQVIPTISSRWGWGLQRNRVTINIALLTEFDHAVSSSTKHLFTRCRRRDADPRQSRSPTTTAKSRDQIRFSSASIKSTKV